MMANSSIEGGKTMLRKYKNMIFCLVLVPLMIISISASGADDPILWFGFEDSGDTVEDGSGNGNEGTIVGATRVADGKYGKGLSIGEKDEYIEISNVFTPQATVEFWLKPNWDGGDGQTYRLLDANNGSQYWQIGKGKANGDQPNNFGLFFENAADKDYDGWQTPAAGVIIANTWHHIAATWDFEGGEAKLYINGEEVGNSVIDGELLKLADNPRIGFNLGNGYMPAGNGANGIIDEFAIYDVALDVDAISDDMDNLAVEPSHKLPAIWGQIKAEH